MRPESILSRLRKVVRAFGRGRSGNVAIIFALALIPIVGVVGAGVDYGHAIAVRTALQAALDSTALMLSKSAANDTGSQLQSAAQTYFDGLFSRPDATNVSVTATYTSSGGTEVVVTGSASVPTSFMGIFGYNSIAVSGSATATWGTSRLRVALVLDNTGSMAQSSKMTELKAATNNLLTQLQNAVVNAGDVYVSIIPFVVDVNVGSSDYTADWIYWGDSTQDPSLTDNTSWDALNGTCSKSGYTTRSTCTAQGSCSISGKTSQSTCTAAGSCSISGYSTQSSCQSAHACSKSQYTSQTQCTSHGGTWETGVWTAGVWTPATWTPASHSTWTGCVMDRGYPEAPSTLSGESGPDTTNNYDTNVEAPNADAMSSLFAAQQYSDCPQAAMGLSYNWSSMSTLVSNMTPAGTTNQAIGLELGWMSLAGGGPFTAPAMDSSYTYSQVIILLTDGLNTQDRWYSEESDIDARQTLTCNNIKAANITLYTVQVSTDGTALSTLLQNCASDSSKFFFLTSSSQIVTTFNQIGTNISQLYLSK